MNKKHYVVSIVTWALISFAAGAALTAHVMAKQTEAIMSRDREQIQIAESQASTCRNTVNLMTAKSTVLYESVPMGVDVLNGIAHIQVGTRVIGMAPRLPRWIVPFAIKPEAMANVPGAAYAYIDKRTGESSQLIFLHQ